MPLFIPSPAINGFDLGPLRIHFYALCLIAGIIIGWIIGLRRWKARGGDTEVWETVLIWAIPFGIVGARIYHVLTHLDNYFGPGIDPLTVFYIWEGGIAIFGAIGGGAIGALIGCRTKGVRFASFADALMPGLAVGQAVGRFGNWFNQELYGLPTELPWALEIEPRYRVSPYADFATFHPTFAYEALWNLFVAATLILIDKRFKLGRGKVLAAYIALYGLGRTFTEGIRTDPSYDTFGPIRFNQAVAMLICLLGIALFIFLVKAKPGRELAVLLRPEVLAEDSSAESASVEHLHLQKSDAPRRIALDVNEPEHGDKISDDELTDDELAASPDSDSLPRRARLDP